MAISNAERQKRYRESRKGGVKNEVQLRAWISISQHNALARLARHQGVTQRLYWGEAALCP